MHCEGVDLSVLEEKHGTPSYIYSKKTIEENAKAYVNSFTNTRNLACFAVKSLSNLLTKARSRCQRSSKLQLMKTTQALRQLQTRLSHGHYNLHSLY